MQMEKMEEKGVHAKRQKGGMVTMPFIFGTASLTPLIGAFCADAFAGRFWTITVASILYQIGMTSLTLSAILPNLRPPPCKGDYCKEANTGQLAVLYASLLLTALGSGGIRPCVVAFGADQFDETDPKQSTKTWKYFNWYYFVMGVSILLAVTMLVYVQDNVGWGLGLGIPSIAMFLSIIAFIVGYPLYRNLDPAGSPFTRLLQVSVAAFRKRKLPMVSDPMLLYQNEELDAPISIGGKLLHTKHMKLLDKAAIVTEEDQLKAGQTPNLWRLNTVHRVEELKSVIRMGPIWAAGILLITAYAQQSTFSLQQAKSMDRHLSKSFQIPAGSMSVFTMTSMLTTIAIYDRFFVPFARRFTGLERGITFLHRMGIGFVISILATLVAGFVEIKRKHVAAANGLLNSHESIPISVFWLVPQYSLHGIAEAFMSIGHLEFFYDQAPESMRSTAMALFWTAISFGNYVSTLLVTLVHKFSAGPDGSNWLPDNNLNKGKLEYFYWLITLMQAINLVYYLICAKMYTFKPIQIHTKEVSDSKDDGVAVELTNKV
ncbi:protein NRT1/ PTR FAMILY 3.1 isoform X2 [Manihot esculenta]|uniref:protein NRT1/ PTR FAMILY 3.1 isoform X2 n=1 Tax=Manihot esculenta TaxID=3983 RepID=UPI000B5D47AB|nr:protein NRT1/ PTR FAMILY 3.1 isoform X2 [Manihot esculenta]